MKVLPAIIAKDQIQLNRRLEPIKKFSRYVMLDIMDGIFVPNRSLDFDYKLPKGLRFQAHLMVETPMKLIPQLVGKAEIVIIHIETVKDVSKTINTSEDYGLEMFLAINPDTPIDAITPHISNLNGVLVMTVHPGRYGSSFLPWCLDKVQALRAMDEKLIIEVDGGMNPETAAMAVEKGADMVAAGSYIVSSEEPKHAYMKLVEAVDEAWKRVKRE